MPAMYTRRLVAPKRSFLLLGPRGTGKTTWLRAQLPNAHWYNLLLDREQLRLMRDPQLFRQEIEALPSGSWVVVDEIQKLPSLINLTTEAQPPPRGRWGLGIFVCWAGGWRRPDVNLLAGRVVMRRMLPLTVAELGKAPSADDLLRFGLLPLVRSAKGAAVRVDLLEAYVESYLAQEIRAEALVRSLEAFTRFLEIAALANAQVTNTAALARDAAVARPTIQGYFEVLNDTLLGHWLPAWRPRAKVKEVQHPKFYLFDPGVVRALSRRLREPLEAAERGMLLETLVFHELRAQIAYSDCGGELSYYRTPSGTEVDFVWTRASHAVGIEVKASERWRPEFNRTLVALQAGGVIDSAWGVYLGEQPLQAGPVRVLPLLMFLGELAAGKVLVGKTSTRKRR